MLHYWHTHIIAQDGTTKGNKKIIDYFMFVEIKFIFLLQIYILLSFLGEISLSMPRI